RRAAARPAVAAAARESHAGHAVDTDPGVAEDDVGRSGVGRARLARPAGDDAGARRVVAPVPGHAAGPRVGAAGAERAPRRAGPLGAVLIAGAIQIDVARAARGPRLTGPAGLRIVRVGAAGEQAGAGGRVGGAAALAESLRLDADVVHAGE